MSDINLARLHSLPIVRAKAVVQKAVNELADEYGLTSEWRGDTLHVHRTGVDGQIDVSGTKIQVHLNLGFLFKPFKSQLIDHIEKSFERLLPKPRVQPSEPLKKESVNRGATGQQKKMMG